MSDIFISYSSHDRLQALSLAEKLRASGYDAWIDQHHIQGASRWGKEIVSAISNSKLVAILISASSLSSENVVKELNLAVHQRKQLLPIMIEEAELTEDFAYHLSGVHRVAIENTESILKALEGLKIRTGSGEDFSPSERTNVRSTPASKDIRLAVLPFDDLSQAHDNEWFADGMLDELITTLGALEHMKVPSRTDVMYYKKHHPKAQEIASDLNVRYLVGGSVRKSGEKIRITASLTDAYSNQQLWTNQFNGSFDDIFDLQERVSKEITETLNLRLTPNEEMKIEEQPTQNAEAYELYLRGMELYRKTTRESYKDAIKFFENAIELDSTFLDPYIAIANTSIAYYRECSREQKWLDRAEANLLQAEKIGGETAKTLWIRGEISWQEQHLEEAENLLHQSITLDPNYAHSFNILGTVYLRLGKNIEAVKAFEDALRISSNHIYYFNLLVALSIVNDQDKIREVAKLSIPIIEKHLRRNPNDLIWKVSYAYILHWAGRNEEALHEADTLAKNENLDGMALFNLGSLFDKLGQPDKDIEMLRKSIDRGYRDIEAFRVYSFDEPHHISQMEELISELSEIIEKRKKSNLN